MNIHHEVTLNASPELVYEVLTNGAKFAEVTGKPAKGGESTGAAFSLFDGWLQGRQVELVPNELIAQAWRFMDWDPGVYSMVRFQLKPEGKGTRVILDQGGVPQAVHEHVRTNWDGFYFDAFKKHFGG
jgi:activator of HSP90 ATPase